MRRKIKDLLSLDALRHLYYIPLIILKVKNWYPFLLNYVGFKDEAETYYFRKGIQIKTNEGIDSATIAVVFIKKDYGEIKDGSIILDIGANIGAFSIYAASKYKHTKVYAYEPMPKSYEMLLKNIAINKLESSVTPFKLGIASSKEKRKLFLAQTSPFHSICSDNNEKCIEINCITLKDIFEDNKIKRCDVLKMDCEGAEFEILYNTPQKYFLRIKEIRLEYHNQKKEEYSINNLTKFLEDNGLKIIFFREDNKYSGNAWFRRK